jgi:hypothetical protein
MADVTISTDVGKTAVNGQNVVLAVGANRVLNATDKTVVLFKNSNAASRTVTITANKASFRASGGHGQITVSDITVTVPGSGTAGGYVAVNPPGADYLSGGIISMTGDANAADVTCNAWNLESRYANNNPKAVGEQTGLQISHAAATTEVGHKLSKTKTVLTSSITTTITCDALALYGDVGQELIEQALRDRGVVIALERSEGVDRWKYRLFCTGLTKNFPNEGSSTWNATFAVDGDPVKLY